MVRVASFAGAVLRPNSSLAGVAGSSGLASGGSGFGLTLPLSCAAAICGANNSAANSHGAARRPRSRQLAPVGAFIVVVMLVASDCALRRPRRSSDRSIRRRIPAYYRKPRAGSETAARVAAGAIRSVSGSATGRDGARAAAIGVGQAGGGVAKQVGFAAGEFEQPSLGRRVQLDRAVGADMSGRQPARGERAADQQAAMAVERLALGAQQAHAMAPRFSDHAVEAGAKRRCRGHGLVVGDAVAVEAGIARAAAERVT